jgi:hypothetical protein
MWDDDDSECRCNDDAHRLKRPIKSAVRANHRRECPALETAPA